MSENTIGSLEKPIKRVFFPQGEENLAQLIM
jgi:hypothetical protein